MRLLLVGGVRNEGDSARVAELKELAVSLQVSVSSRPSRRSLIYVPIVQTMQEYVDFVVNAPYSTILDLLGESSIGLNTMVDEHFGINVVEFMVGPIFPLQWQWTSRLADGVIVALDLGRWRYTHRACVRRSFA